MNTPIVDIHTHRLDATAALIAVDPRQFEPQPGRYYSVGFHPWLELDSLTEDDFSLLEQCASHPQVLAIGETGMDRLRGAALDVQASVFARHLQLAHDVGMPVVAHCVRASQDILDVLRSMGLTNVPVIIHGMRSNQHVARALLEAGCHLSYGARFNAEALMSTPLERLLIETDDASTTIDDVAGHVAQVTGTTAEHIKEIAAGNAQRLLTK
ncbi:MAG: TatD family hydrolase [Muribaculaceae bacterium]|nr:TatD family hydrolase [Muribaculaceae bacterium]